MPDTIIVANRAHMPIRITEPHPNPEKPGDSPVLRTQILNGSNHADALGGEGITRGVDADLFRRWREDAVKARQPLAEMLREVSEDDIKDRAVSFGFEPGLAAAKDAKAAEGSTDKTERPGQPDMAAHSDTPPGLERVPADQIKEG